MSRESELLAAVVQSGTDADLAAWARSGRAGLLELRSALTERQTRWPDVHPKDEIDALSAAAAAIAVTSPDEYLEVFADRQFDGNGFVLTGLGQIDDPRATDRLVKAAGSPSWSTRMAAAIGLGRRPADNAIGALLNLLDDRDYLVRYHTIRSLGAIGDAEALRALRAFRDDPGRSEKDLARAAIHRIEKRIEGRAPPRSEQRTT
jgi:HEAT repeat protein